MRDLALLVIYVNMTDINNITEIRYAIERLFFAYRDFTAVPDTILKHYGFGRAHHRVIYFVGKHPQITVNDLLLCLQITKQSLSRVLQQLIQEGYIHQEQSPIDKRKRLLTLTKKGISLEQTLTEYQGQKIQRAFDRAGQNAVKGFYDVLNALIDSP